MSLKKDGLSFGNLTAEEHKRSSTRGSNAAQAIYYIDGKPYYGKDVCKELDTDKVDAYARIRREKERKGGMPLTWENLRVPMKKAIRYNNL